jgi:hypothetical protein
MDRQELLPILVARLSGEQSGFRHSRAQEQTAPVDAEAAVVVAVAARVDLRATMAAEMVVAVVVVVVVSEAKASGVTAAIHHSQ